MPRAGMPRSPSEQGGKRQAPSASARKRAGEQGLSGARERKFIGATINRARAEKAHAKAEGARKGMGRPPAAGSPASEKKPRAKKPKKTSAEDAEIKRLRAELSEARGAKANKARAAREEKLANTPESKIRTLTQRKSRLMDEKRAIQEEIRELNARVRRGNAGEMQARVLQKARYNERLEAIDAELGRIEKKLVEIAHARASRGPSAEVSAAALRAAAEDKARTRGRRGGSHVRAD